MPKAVAGTVTQPLATSTDARRCLEQDSKWTRGVGVVLGLPSPVLRPW